MKNIKKFNIYLKHNAPANTGILNDLILNGIPFVNFNALIPIPKNINNVDEEFDFCLKNWGSKYNAAPPKKRVNFKNNEFHFRTIENFPIEWLLMLSKKWKEIFFEAFVETEVYDENAELCVEHFMYTVKNGEYSLEENHK